MTVQVKELLAGTPVTDGRGYASVELLEVITRLVAAVREGGGSGAGLPIGGATGQVLTKQSASDGDADWQTIIISGGGA